MSRRRFLKWAGAANLTIVAGTTAVGSSNQHFEGYPNSLGVLFDSTLCIGCRKCEKGCQTVNELPTPEKPFDDLTVLKERRRTTNNAFTVVNNYGSPAGSGAEKYRKIQCNHCLEPACAAACFVKAFSKTPSGAVVYDESVCVGCRYCMIACPFEIPTYEYDEPLTPRVRKCDMCHPRILEGLLPGCVESCPTEALNFGKRDALLKIARERIGKNPHQYTDHIYGEKEMGGTNWLYLAGTRFEEIGLSEHLGNKPAIEYTAGTLSAVPIIVGLWPVLLTGAYAMTKRREKVTREEQATAVTISVEQTNAVAAEKLTAALAKADRMKQKEIDSAVKKALAEVEKKDDEEKPSKTQEDNK
ncbi:MAG: 4Fe-4S dicluster domain-containing protein [SAR324 cluster bacterium]|nr:4Fe-4S dicluster domain-containing protein [SAR324 cluster bacterium]